MTTVGRVKAVLVEDGFSEELVADGARLRVVSSEVEYDPHELVVSRIIRFGRISTDEEEALLFALSTKDGQAVGTYAPVAEPVLSDVDAAIVTVLDDQVLPTIEHGDHTGHDHIAAIFDERSEAKAAVAELHSVGIDKDLIGLALKDGDPRAFERDAETEMLQGTGRGLAAGGALGFLGGLSIAALVLVPGGLIGLGGVLALGGGASMGGAMLGGYLGVGAGNRAFDERAEFANVPLEPGQTLIAVCSHGDPVAVSAIMERHNGQLIRRAQED